MALIYTYLATITKVRKKERRFNNMGSEIARCIEKRDEETNWFVVRKKGGMGLFQDVEGWKTGKGSGTEDWG